VDIQAFADRRARLLRSMGRGIAVIPTAPERVRNRDSHYPYRHDSYFYYLTGFPRTRSRGPARWRAPRSRLLFCREKDPRNARVWDGYRLGPEAARAAFGFDEAWPIGSLDDRRLPELLADQPGAVTQMGLRQRLGRRRCLGRAQRRARQGPHRPHAPAEIRDVRVELDEMRLVKDASRDRHHAPRRRISGAAHCRAMRATRPGRHEYEIEAELLHEFRRRRQPGPAYTSIVAGGANACVLHYVDNDQRLRDGDLLLIDAGCELDGYASDITRTFPVSAASPVRSAMSMSSCSPRRPRQSPPDRPARPGTQPHDAAVKVLAQGMLDLGCSRAASTA
jgi:Xaa-Pro aminopeptidase